MNEHILHRQNSNLFLDVSLVKTRHRHHCYSISVILSLILCNGLLSHFSSRGLAVKFLLTFVHFGSFQSAAPQESTDERIKECNGVTLRIRIVSDNILRTPTGQQLKLLPYRRSRGLIMLRFPTKIKSSKAFL